jgi:hypothetical protein
VCCTVMTCQKQLRGHTVTCISLLQNELNKFLPNYNYNSEGNGYKCLACHKLFSLRIACKIHSKTCKPLFNDQITERQVGSVNEMSMTNSGEEKVDNDEPINLIEKQARVIVCRECNMHFINNEAKKLHICLMDGAIMINRGVNDEEEVEAGEPCHVAKRVRTSKICRCCSVKKTSL